MILKLQERLAKLLNRGKCCRNRWGSLMKTLKQPGTDPVALPPEQYKAAVKAVLICAAALIVFIGVIIYQYAALSQAQSQNELHEQQLELMREKITSLQEKVDKMDALDQELRQLVKGEGTGSDPKGSGGAAGQRTKSPDLSNADYNDLLLATARLETRMNARIIGFVTLKTVLEDTAGASIRPMQQLSRQYAESSSPAIWPVEGTVSSYFGYRGNPIGGGTGFHEGLDIAVDYGTPVRATASGEVTLAGWVEGYGYLVEIDHGSGIVTRYGHNSMILAVEGQNVRTGDMIALAGSTGRSTGPHVHYEVRVQGTPTDPLLFLP